MNIDDAVTIKNIPNAELVDFIEENLSKLWFIVGGAIDVDDQQYATDLFVNINSSIEELKSRLSVVEPKTF